MVSVKKLNKIAAPTSPGALKLVMFGAGELGKEIFVEAQRLGMECIAVDRYERAPAAQIAHKSYTFNMMDGNAMRSVVEREKPDVIIPEIEAIDLDTLIELEKEGYRVIPNARATWITMHRERIRELIAKEAKVETCGYTYARTDDPEEFKDGVEKIGYPCISKAIMSSSGHGSYDIKGEGDIEKARQWAIKDARGEGSRVIIEEFIDFDTEITELALRHLDEDGKIVTTFPRPIGHYQIEGDYHSSWQSPKVSEYLPWGAESGREDEGLAETAERKIYEAAGKITGALGGVGIFGCELFVKEINGEVKVYGNECSPRPHDTGMVTYISHIQGFNEGGLHVRAITGLPIPAKIREVDGREFRVFDPIAPASSHVIKSPSEGWDPQYRGLWNALSTQGVNIYMFGKPMVYLTRGRVGIVEERMGLALALGENALDAKKKAEVAAHNIEMRTRQVHEWKSQDQAHDGRKKHLFKHPG